jgi:hypothetical protein
MQQSIVDENIGIIAFRISVEIFAYRSTGCNATVLMIKGRNGTIEFHWLGCQNGQGRANWKKLYCILTRLYLSYFRLITNSDEISVTKGCAKNDFYAVRRYVFGIV